MKNKQCHYMAHNNLGDTHEILNVSMLIMLSHIYNTVIVHAPKDCCSILKEQVAKISGTDNNIQYRNSSIITKKKIPFWIYGGIKSIIVMLQHRNDIFFYATLNPYFFPIINFFDKIFHVKMYTLCHNDLEHLINKKTGTINLHWRLINYIFKKMHFAKNNICLVLGKSILDNLELVLPYDSFKNCAAIYHPYYGTNTEQHVKNNFDGIKIGIVGTIKPTDYENLKEVDQILDDFPNIQLFSLSTSGLDLNKLKHVTNLNPNNSHLNREEYDKMISNMDVLYYPYPSNSYRVSASGAIYESIIKQKPYISVSNDYFNWLNTEFGQLGYMFNKNFELKAILKQLGDNNATNTIKENELKAMKALNPNEYWRRFKDTLKL